MHFRVFSILLLATGLAFPQKDMAQRELLTPALIQKAKKQNIPSLDGDDLAARLITDAQVDDQTYHLGPGDILTVQLGMPTQVVITPEGKVLLPEVSPVAVGGSTLAEARMRIKKALKPFYDTSKVHVSLAAANVFKIQIAGEVANPGMKVVNSFTRVGELLAMAGGFTKYAVRDSIRIIHGDGTQSAASFADYYRTFKDSDNPFLSFGDKVMVDPIDFSKPFCTLKLSGGFHFHKVGAPYNLKEIFLQAGSYSQNNLPPHARVSHGNGKERILGPSELLTYYPEAKDTIEYLKEVDFVFVGGSVARPSMYEYVPNYSVSDYLYQAGVTTQSGDGSKFLLVRGESVAEQREIDKTGVRPGDKIYLKRNKSEMTRDYLGIIVPLASIIISAATLYYTVK